MSHPWIEADPFPSVKIVDGLPRDDSWQNPFMGYGTAADKITYGFHAYSPTLSTNELTTLFYSDDVAAKLVEKRPEEAFRRGYQLLNRDDQAAAAELYEQGRALGLNAKFQEAATWGRLFGGCLLVIGADAGQPWTPLDETKVRDVKFLNVVDRRFCAVEKYYSDPLQPNYGQPEIYAVFGLNGIASFVHESRVIRFDGLQVDSWKRRELGGWTYSVLQRPYDVMRTFATAFQAAGVLTTDASQPVFKLKGLFEMIASGEKSRLQTRMRLLDMSRSSGRAVVLDAEGEDFTRVPTPFQGLPEMLDRMMMRLASSIDMPVTILMGRSPAGQNATGDSDFQHWYDSIASEQEKEWTPKLLRLYRILSRGKLDRLEIDWLPLAEPTDKEKADIMKTRAEAYGVYIDKGVLFAEEVALAEFGKTSNGQVEIDEEARQKSLEAEQELALTPQPPQPPDQVPPVVGGALGPQPTPAQGVEPHAPIG